VARPFGRSQEGTQVTYGQVAGPAGAASPILATASGCPGPPSGRLPAVARRAQPAGQARCGARRGARRPRWPDTMADTV